MTGDDGVIERRQPFAMGRTPVGARALYGALWATLAVLACGPAGAQSTVGSAAAALPDLQTRLQAARDSARTYSDQLKGQLSEAIKSGGIKGAVGQCTTIAPDLNSTVSEQSLFEIGRTALKLRNPDNAPDPWERANLELFVKQLAAGGDHKAMEAYDVTTTKEGQKLFRYMRPILTGEMCLGCHGPAVAQDIKQEIARSYPDDKATGYTLGELRGAFTLVQEVE
jgi:hypothetical protein